MKNLIEISKIITKKKVRKIEIFDDYSLRNKSSKFNEFYESLIENKFRNDRDAAHALYECSPKDARYRQLKSRFRRRLLNTLFFLDINKAHASSYDRALYTCHREWAQIKILQQYHAHHSAEALARSLLTIALKYQLTDIILNCARLLRDYYADMGDAKAFSEYSSKVVQYTKVLIAEMQAEEIYHQVKLEYMTALAIDESVDKRIEDYSQKLLTLSDEHESSVILLYAYLVWSIRFEMRYDYDALLEVCERAMHTIESSPDLYPQDKILLFQTKKMLAFLHLRDYNRGQKNAEEVLLRFKEGTEEWLNFMEYYLLLALHTGQYIQALAIYNRAATKVAYRKVDSKLRDQWTLYESYIHFLMSLTPISLKIAPLRGVKKFQLENFLDDDPVYTRKQRILQVSAMILRVLFLLQNKKYALADNLISKLQYIANRQLKKNIHNRHIQFIRLLQQLRKANYDLDELKGTKKYQDRLQQTPFFYRGLPDQLEIIPYENLWKMILDILRTD